LAEDWSRDSKYMTGLKYQKPKGQGHKVTQPFSAKGVTSQYVTNSLIDFEVV